MPVPNLLDRTSQPVPRADPLARLEHAITAAMDAIAAVPAGHLVSLTVELPNDLPSIHPAGDCRWLSPDGDCALYAAGEAFRIALAEPAAFEAHRAAWTALGDIDAPPLAFWTMPPALDPALPELWVPRVLLRRADGHTTLTVSLLRGAVPVPVAALRWLEDARSLLGGGTERTLPAIAARIPGSDLADWSDRVRRTTAAIAEGRLAKAVLARKLTVRLAGRADARALADRLATLHPSCATFCLPHGPGHVVAASPERLAVKRGSRVSSAALAGTTRRHASRAADAMAAAELLASPKEREEHAIVADTISEALAEVCATVERPDAPAIMRLRQVQHLWTEISGTLKPGTGFLDVVARLHPTPAVLGAPRKAALDWLGEMNEGRDGLYTGVAGWIDRNGDGEAAMVLRSAYVEDRTAVLWAGAGIVAGSDPGREWTETDLKLSTLLNLFSDP
ncbi:isochorismate synthase [Rhodobium gokarnense]|uniref:isochorismate synthase n=1 Tax=Rhodobium gokarnense TaxID=364296 RepID=A0ABT3HF75_9HYPH|nr:chorismate-binding protein [Rhodobium gokarnense]MCW2309053.1 menaquinone-specific isochorismate synthase [Rhodobium gokarnense]